MYIKHYSKLELYIVTYQWCPVDPYPFAMRYVGLYSYEGCEVTNEFNSRSSGLLWTERS
jgi:hypothetical protein